MSLMFSCDQTEDPARSLPAVYVAENCEFFHADDGVAEERRKVKYKSIFGGGCSNGGRGLKQGDSGRTEQQQRESASSCLSDRWREGGREGGRVRQGTAGGDKVDKKRSPHPNPLRPLSPSCLFINHSLFPPLLSLPPSHSSISFLIYIQTLSFRFLSVLSPALLFFLLSLCSVWVHLHTEEKPGYWENSGYAGSHTMCLYIQAVHQ